MNQWLFTEETDDWAMEMGGGMRAVARSFQLTGVYQ